MKKILGLDLGTASIGWALVNEAEIDSEQSSIIKLGVRVIQYDTFSKVDKLGKVTESKNPVEDFSGGKGLSPNAKRTQQRGARRNLQRFKLRRTNLIEILKSIGFISDTTQLTEQGSESTHETFRLRALAASERIEKNEFARVLLAINKKRGYKSSRKAKNDEEGSLIDGMSVAKELYNDKLTPGEFVFNLLNEDKKYIPDFYRSDLQGEFDAIWNVQRDYYPDVLNNALYKDLQGKNKTQTWAVCQNPFEIVGVKLSGNATEKRMERYQWRMLALKEKIDLEYLAIALQEINNNLNQSSGYLGAISDRSKALYFNKETVGQNLYKQLQVNFHTSLKNQAFYRQDYLDEFEQIWETQAKYYSELTPVLKEEVRDVIIFYQRKLKSQKHLISTCEFEKYHKAIPKSSPLFQEFKIWQMLNNIELLCKETKVIHDLSLDNKQILFEELNWRGNLKADAVLNVLDLDKKKWTLNYTEGIEGNRTNEALYDVYKKIAENEGYGFDWAKKSTEDIKTELKTIFTQIGIEPEVLDFNSNIEGNAFDKQVAYQLWHVLYSAEDDDKISEVDKLAYGDTNVTLKKKLHLGFGFKPEYGNMLANVSFQPDYGRLSARAIKKILPFLKDGHEFSEACSLAKYNHSHSFTKDELASRTLNDSLDLLQKNSLRNPVVEKILNQMVNVVNQVIETYGKPDEVRVELARDLKKSAKERTNATTQINAAKTKHEGIRKLLQSEFGLKNPTRNDIIRYKLYQELSENGYCTLFTNQYISPDKLFSKQIDIEHIIPKAVLFDDSFSNKTLAYRDVNLAKADSTAFDFISNTYADDLENYKTRVESLYKADKISKGKQKKLLMPLSDLPDGFIERDLRNSQYIAKKAKQMLFDVVRTVNTSTGSVTDKLRDDWGLINVMKELNLPKYRALGLTEMQERKEGKMIEQIIDWTKRNDHRHHAMDALTVAFTSYNHVQYLNNLNASRYDKDNNPLFAIRNKITKVYELKNGNKKRRFVPPMSNFRTEAKTHLEGILISFKAKNKVLTKNKNRIKLQGSDATYEKVQLTPRGQLHKETVYGLSKEQVVSEVKINAKLSLASIARVTKPQYREALIRRLAEFGNDSKKAFAGKNSPAKNPIYIDEAKTIELPDTVKVLRIEDNYSIRKEVSPENFKDLKSLDKVLDEGIKRVLIERLKAHGGDAKKAFSDLAKKPIWMNEEQGIAIKRVRISGVRNAEALHDKKDQYGNLILSEEGKTQPVDFVSTGNNHHVAIYRDDKGKLQEQVVSFYEAVARVNAGVSIIDYDYKKKEGWQFLFTMKQNEMFVFPSDDFNPEDFDLLDIKNSSIISKHLFRVQKIANKDYSFRHHLETIVQDVKELKNKAYKRVGPIGIDNVVKVRLNHLGLIVAVGEEVITENINADLEYIV
jgi:CRISPR-associated endonuclease Csn1